jgi:hypothetical protein
MTDPAKAFKRLSAAEALRALYIDFEGRCRALVLVSSTGTGSRRRSRAPSTSTGESSPTESPEDIGRSSPNRW